MELQRLCMQRQKFLKKKRRSIEFQWCFGIHWYFKYGRFDMIWYQSIACNPLPFSFSLTLSQVKSFSEDLTRARAERIEAHHRCKIQEPIWPDRLMMSFAFFCCVWTCLRTLAGNEGESTCICAVYLEFLEISPFRYKSHFHQNLFFVCRICNHQKIPIRKFMCVEGDFLTTKHWGYKNGKREREFGAKSKSSCSLFVQRCRFSDGFLKSTTHGGNESKMCHQGLLAKNMSRKEVPTNSYDLDEIGRQKMVF